MQLHFMPSRIAIIISCFVLFLAGLHAAEVKNYDLSGIRERFKEAFEDKKNVEFSESSKDPMLQFVSISADIVELNAMAAALAPVSPAKFNFRDRTGQLWIHGTKPDDIHDLAERNRFILEKNHAALNLECLNSVAHFRRELLSRLLKIADGSTGNAKTAYMKLYARLADDGLED